MNYSESVEYLYSLGNEVLAMKLGLENIRKVLTALENPHKEYKKIQVAGTNGKGSTCAFLEAICLAASVKTGLFTSPHLMDINERIRINGADIGDEDFARLATQIRETSEKLFSNGEIESIPTFFEQVTTIALTAFAEAGVELAILETGMGGRFDAVTAAEAEIAAITPIDLDHQKILGNTLADIAAEKAAVIWAGSKVVVSRQPADAKKVILARCDELGIKPIRTDFDLPDCEISLKGRHQLENAKVAVCLARILDIDEHNIVDGLGTAKHKGRLEYYKGILFDGAHNLAGAKALSDYLDEFVDRPVTLIFGAMRDKDVREIIEILMPRAKKLIFTVADNPRSMHRDEFEARLPADLDEEKLYFTDDAAQAIALAKQLTHNEGLICVTGSLYLVGEVQKLLTQTV